METSAEEIRRQMTHVRNEIDGDVDDLVAGAQSLFDWRDYVRSHPLASVGLGCALGLALVPAKKSPTVKADASEVAGLLGNRKLVVAPNAKVKQQGTLASTIVATVAGTLVRAAVGYAGQRASAAIHGTAADDLREE